jgi:two-component system, NarL family, capsular synthesis sensor histidine kinase RcsC
MNGKKKSILVVDDELLVAASMKRLLESEGYDVQTAKDGHEALALFEPEKFVLIFTDFGMSEMNGHELASVIKVRAPHQPIVMVTAYADQTLDTEPPPHIDMVLGKPWTIEEIRDILRKFCNQK